MEALDTWKLRLKESAKNLGKAAFSGLLVSQTLLILIHYSDVSGLYWIGSAWLLALLAQIPYAIGHIIRLLMLTVVMTSTAYMAVAGFLATAFILLGFDFPFPVGSLAFSAYYAPPDFSGRLATTFVPFLVGAFSLAAACISGALIWINILALWPSLEPGSFTDRVLQATGADLWRGLAKYAAFNRQSAVLATALGAGATYVAAEALDEDGDFIVPIGDWVTDKQARWIEERTFKDWDALDLSGGSIDDVYGVNPSTGLPMADDFIDVGGNAYGMDNDWHSMGDSFSSSINSDSLFD